MKDFFVDFEAPRGDILEEVGPARSVAAPQKMRKKAQKAAFSNFGIGSTMYKIIGGALLVVLSLLIAIIILPVTDRDQAVYQELLESSNPEQKSLLTFSEQMREGVIKEIWYSQEGAPLYVRIKTDSSELFFFHQEGEVEVVEQFGKVLCLMQEELYFEEEKPMQLVRYMEGGRACYNYNTGLFVAEDVKLWRYRLEGHEPVLTVTDLKPLMEGTAHSVEFTIKGKKLDFQAHRLRATFHEQEKLL